MLNKIRLMGRLGNIPEIGYIQKRTPVARFTLAVERDFQHNSSEKQTDFINCVAWDKIAEVVRNSLQIGQLVVVSGKLQSRKRQDQEGINRTQWEVVVENIYFSTEKYAEISTSETLKSQSESPFVELLDDDELPF